MLRRSWFPLCAWLVLLISVAALFASPTRLRKSADEDAVPASSVNGRTHASAHRPWLDASSRPSEPPKKPGSSIEAPNPGAGSSNASTDFPPSTPTTATEQPKVSGWSFGPRTRFGTRFLSKDGAGTWEWWLQKIIDAKRSWTVGSHSDPAPQTSSDEAAKDPTPSGGSLVSGVAGGNTMRPNAGASGSGTGSPAVATSGSGGGSGTGSPAVATSGSGGGSGTGSPAVATSGSGGGSGTGNPAVATSGSGGGSGTDSTSVPPSGGSGAGNDSPGLGALGGATSGSAYAGGTSTGSGTNSNASAPPSAQGQTRDPAYWPFAATSPWNYPIGSNAKYVPDTRFAMSWYGLNVFIGSASDPVITIWCGNDKAPGYDPVVQAAPLQQNVPDSAAPAGGGDRAITFIDKYHLVAQDMSGARRLDIGWRGWGCLRNVDLKGQGWDLRQACVGGPCYGQTTAIGVPHFAGMIRQGELRSGNIPHAMAFVLAHWMWNRNAPSGGGYVWPGTSADGYWNNPLPGGFGVSGNLFEGGLVALLPSFDLNQLKTPEGRTIGKALQLYGMYGVNSSGSVSSTLTFVTDQYVGPELPGNPAYTGSSTKADFLADLHTMASNIQIVTNSYNPTNGGKPRNGFKLDGGDGTLPVPLAPPFNH